MKNKTFSLLSLSILAVLVLASFASAASLSTPSALPLTAGAHTFNIEVTGTANESITFSGLADITENGKTIDFTTIPSSLNIAHATGVAQTLVISYTVPSDFEFKFGKTYSTTLSAVAGSGDASRTISFEQAPFYSGANQGELSISELDLDNVAGFGDEDDKVLYPFDKADITFYVENNGDSKVKNIKIEVCVWDVSAGKCVFDEGDMDISSDKFDLKSDKDQKVTVTFVPDADKLKEGNTNYIFYVRAVGEIDDSDSAYDGDKTGDSDSYDFEITTDDSFVIINNIQLNTESASCGDTVELTADVWNVGDENLDDDEVFVWAYNKELGIDKKIEFNNGIDAMESEKISFTFKIPDNAAEKIYSIRLGAYNDDSFGDGDLFEADNGDDDEAVFYAPLTIGAGVCSTTPSASVTAALQSEAKAGQELTVKATITNTDSASNTFNLALTGYNTWASLVSIDKSSVTLAAGASQDVLIVLKANDDISGDQRFNIGLTQGTKSLSQPVSVSIAENKPGISLPGLSGLFSGSSWIWVIGALNVILVLVIIVVAVKVSKKK
jgi:hypothetical protein